MKDVMMSLLTAANTYFTANNPQRSTADKLILAGTLALTIDVFVTPLMTGGPTLHEIMGIGPQSLRHSELYFYTKLDITEKAAAGLGNVYLGVIELMDYYKRKTKPK
jgi:hypothetical protein